MTISSILGCHQAECLPHNLTVGFYLVSSYVEFVSDEQLTSVIVYNGLKRYNSIPNINAIRTSKCVYVMYLFNDNISPVNIKCCMCLIYSVHPKNYAGMGTAICSTPKQMGIQCTKMKCRRFGLSTFWFVDVLVRRHFGLSTFWFVDVPVCRRFCLSTFWFFDVFVCRRFGLSTFLFVDVFVCRRFGLSTFGFVDVWVCRRFGCRRLGLSTFWPVTRQSDNFEEINLFYGSWITATCTMIL